MEKIVKACPKCHQPLEIKTNRETGHEFLGCSGWKPGGQGCKYTEELPEAIKLRRAGQPDMFGDA
jgi:ssDNA-binding Zn-finger/Zn-ribbon topoisomerase 1